MFTARSACLRKPRRADKTSSGSAHVFLFLASLAGYCFPLCGPAINIVYAAPPVDIAADRISVWFGYERHDFQVDGRACLLVVPKTPAQGKPWIWRTEFFGHEPQADRALLAKGFHVAYMNVENMYGAPIALDHMDQFYAHLTEVRGLSSKAVLEGFSRGGLFSLNWAARRPERVACIYNDAPVCDFKSWPGGRGKGKGSPGDWQRLLAVYKISEADALSYPSNSVDNLELLAKASIPLLHVCGDADDIVPINENTRLVESRYRQLGGPMVVIVKPGVGHHPHSLVDPTPIVAFVVDHTLGSESDGFLPESPLDYQVFQRDSLATGKIRVSGWLDEFVGETKPKSLLCRLVAPAKDGIEAQTVIDGRLVPVDRESGRYDDLLEAPAGGWYRIELEAIRDGKPPKRLAIEHVGIGEVFVVAGQSNSTNYGAEQQKTSTGLVSSFDGLQWTLANDPQPGVQDGSTGGSFLPAFGDALARKYHVPIGVASVGAGATSVRQWLPKGERMTNRPTIVSHVREIAPGQWEATGDLFEGLANRIAALGPRGFRAVLWHQGESDAGQTRGGYPSEVQITGEQYREFMEKLVRASRQRAGWDIPWLTAQATYHNPQDAADEEFRAAQRSLWESGLTLPGPDTDALGPDYREGVHFNGKGLQAHGKLWAAKVEALIGP